MNYFINFILLLIVIIEAQAIAPSNDPSGTKLCFETHVNDLPWPIADLNNPFYGTIHGIHCAEVVSEVEVAQRPLENDNERMHYEHCKRLVIKMFNSLQKEPSTYNMSPTMCYHLVNKGKLEKRGIFYLGYCWTCYSGRKKRSLWQQSADESNEVFNKIKQKTTNQIELFHLIGGHNFGDILYHGYRNASRTTAEANYYNSLESDQIIRLGALGVVCKYGGHISVATKSIQDAMPGFIPTN